MGRAAGELTRPGLEKLHAVKRSCGLGKPFLAERIWTAVTEYAGYLAFRRGSTVNKAELVAQVADKSGLTKKDSEKAVSAVFETIEDALAKGDKVSLVGFGTFERRVRKAREGRNPQTGATVKIKEAKVPVFKAGKALKDRVNI